MFKFWETVPKKYFKPPALKSWGDVRLRDSHLTTCGLPHFHIRFPPPLFHLFTFPYLSSLCTPEAYTPINCYMQNTINILCPNWSLPCKKLLSRESSDLDISKIPTELILLIWWTRQQTPGGASQDQRSQKRATQIHWGQRAQGEHSQQPMESTTTRITAHLCWQRPFWPISP